MVWSSNKSSTRKRSRKATKPARAKAFPLSHISIAAIVFTFGAASVTGGVMSVLDFGLGEQLTIALCAIVAIVAGSIAIIPLLAAGPWSRADGLGKAIGLVLIAPIMIFDGGFQYNAISHFEKHSNGAAKIERRLDQAKAALDAIPTPSATGEIRTRATYELVVTTAQKKVDDIQAELDAIQPLPIEFILSLLSGFQIASFFLRAWLVSVTATEQKRLNEEFEDAQKKADKRTFDRKRRQMIIEAKKEELAEKALRRAQRQARLDAKKAEKEAA